MSENPLTETAEKFYGKSEESEPVEPTETPDVTEADDQAPRREAEDLDKPEGELEPELEPEESEADGEGEESLFIELDGKEVDLEDVKKWRDGHLMQKDYTKKTTEHARNVEAWEQERKSERENLSQERSKLSEMQDMLTVLVAEDEEIDWSELKEYEPERYIELREKADKRKAALEKVKAEREVADEDPAIIQQEVKKFFDGNPSWLDEEGNTTKAYADDMKLINDYASTAGYTPDEFSKMTRAHHMNTVLKAAKYDKLMKKSKEIAEKREKVPVVPKPKATQKPAAKRTRAETFYGPG